MLFRDRWFHKIEDQCVPCAQYGRESLTPLKQRVLQLVPADEKPLLFYK